VAVEELEPTESVWLDLTDVADLFGGEAALVETLIRELLAPLSLGGRGAGGEGACSSSIAAVLAVADTPGAAWAVAHGTPVSSGVTAVVVPLGETAVALRPLPIELLRLPPAAVDLLHEVGVYQIGQLELLPRAELTARFGAILLDRWDQAFGLRAETLPVVPVPPELAAHWACDDPLPHREAVLAVVQRLLDPIAATLIERGLGALRVECRLSCEGGTAIPLGVGVFQPTASVRHLLPLLQLRLERLPLPGPVVAVDVEVPLTARLLRPQQDLFGEAPPLRAAQQLTALVDRLSSRLGSRAVLRPRLVTDAQPELAVTYDPLVELAARRQRGPRGTSRVAVGALPPRPLRLMPRPAALGVISIVPDGPPLKFQWHGRQHQIAWHWGPERIETGWWRGRIVGRDYYRIETSGGQRYWIYRRLRDGQWFLQGLFE